MPVTRLVGARDVRVARLDPEMVPMKPAALGGAFDEAFGVPAHPLVVHAPVVLLPIATVATVVLAIRPDWRRRVGWWMPVAVLALVAVLFAARESGEAALDAENVFGDVDEHERLGRQTFLITVAWLVAAVAVVAADMRSSARSPVDGATADGATARRELVAVALGVVAATAALVAMIWLIRTGHSGAKSRWLLD